MTPALASIIGGVAAGLYFAAGESKIPKSANCSYLAAPLTDYLAWAGGAYLMIKGATANQPGISFVGSAITGIHLAQYAAHKQATRVNVGACCSSCAAGKVCAG